ncbi:MAG: GAF domain-containing protein [Actinobacteria bacterium]|nr:GAF domain-containing protein [Actinomycetota bacterium]
MTIGTGSTPRPTNTVVVDGMTFAAYQEQVRAALVRDGAERADLIDWLTRVCRASVDMLAAAGATVTAIDSTISATADHGTEADVGADIDGFGRRVGGSRHLMAASSFAARALADAQGTLGCGPGIDVAAVGRTILVRDLAVDGPARWPAFTRLALARGVRAAFAFPLEAGAVRLGVLTVYREHPGTLSPRERWTATALANEATRALNDAGDPLPDLEVAGPPDRSGS